jgi:hypothetical protein
MINNENDEKSKDNRKPDDQTKVDILAHIQIKDVDTGTVLVNKRG